MTYSRYGSNGSVHAGCITAGSYNANSFHQLNFAFFIKETLPYTLKCLVWQGAAKNSKKHKFFHLILMDFVGR
jgi:hypothetical protein